MGMSCYDSPFGKLFLTSESGNIVGLSFSKPKDFHEESDPVLMEAKLQLSEYFSKTRKKFDLPILLRGTPFRMLVWNALLEIPYGEVRTYGDIAEIIGNPKAARAVGGACHNNPIGIIVPCHRVIGAGGSLTGFGGGIELKEKLIEMEK